MESRRAAVDAAHDARRAEWDVLEKPDGGQITPRCLTACVRDLLAGEDALVLTEAVTNFQVVAKHLRAGEPGTLIGAIGAKLAAPERIVVSVVGDGAFLFGVPASAQWVSRRYRGPGAHRHLRQPRLEGGAFSQCWP